MRRGPFGGELRLDVFASSFAAEHADELCRNRDGVPFFLRTD
jgi:hypothetical protein